MGGLSSKMRKMFRIAAHDLITEVLPLMVVLTGLFWLTLASNVYG